MYYYLFIMIFQSATTDVQGGQQTIGISGSAAGDPIFRELQHSLYNLETF